MEQVRKQIHQKIKELQLKKSSLWLACSGGMDSMVLGHLLWTVAQELSFSDFKVLHVNYGLRGEESDGDQALVESHFKSLGLRVEVLNLKTEPAPHSGIQEWARERRYQWFDKMAADEDLIAIAHHQGDLAENIIFRLARGVGGQLSGMQLESGKHWRPLLAMARADISNYCHRQNVPYRDDSTNAKIIYSRNRIRQRVIPELEKLFSGAGARLVETAQDLDDVLSFVDESLSHLSDEEQLKWSSIAQLPEAVARRVITNFLRKAEVRSGLDRNLVYLLYQGLSASKDCVYELSGVHRVEVMSGVLSINSKSISTQRQDQYRAQLSPCFDVLLPPNASLTMKVLGAKMFLQNSENESDYQVIKLT